jgi:hypothetical protein
MLSEWTQVRLHPSFKVEGPGEGLLAYTGPLERPGLLGYTTYFGLLFGANGWWKLTSRGRQSRLRIFPVIKVGLVALVLAALWPFSQPWGICVAVLIAMLVQLVSPWNEGAAAYAHYSAARRKTA